MESVEPHKQNRKQLGQARKSEGIREIVFRGEVPRPSIPLFLDLRYLETAVFDFFFSCVIDGSHK